MKTKTTIISAFPGCGKTYFYNEYKDGFVFRGVIDSDSSEFSWIKDENGNNTKERNPEFPNNYINHIKENIGKVDIIFVSSHDIVRKALKDNNIEYILVYPCIEAKKEYINRYLARGSSDEFVNFINNNYENFILDMKKEDFPHKIELNFEETISDLIKYGYCNEYVAKYLYNFRGCPIECNNCSYRQSIQ